MKELSVVAACILPAIIREDNRVGGWTEVIARLSMYDQNKIDYDFSDFGDFDVEVCKRACNLIIELVLCVVNIEETLFLNCLLVDMQGQCQRMERWNWVYCVAMDTINLLCEN